MKWKKLGILFIVGLFVIGIVPAALADDGNDDINDDKDDGDNDRHERDNDRHERNNDMNSHRERSDDWDISHDFDEDNHEDGSDRLNRDNRYENDNGRNRKKEDGISESESENSNEDWDLSDDFSDNRYDNQNIIDNQVNEIKDKNNDMIVIYDENPDADVTSVTDSLTDSELSNKAVEYVQKDKRSLITKIFRWLGLI